MASLAAIREPTQQRSRATWGRVLDAGLELLEEGCYATLTIDAICARAGTTPPSVYARAGNKDGLLSAIYDHAMQRIDAASIDPADPSWRELDPEATVRRAVGAMCDAWLRNAGLLRPIVHRAAQDPEVFRRGSAESRRSADDYRAVLSRVGISRRDADATFRMTYAALVQRVMYGGQFESSVPLGERSFRAMLADAAVRYLAVAGPRT